MLLQAPFRRELSSQTIGIVGYGKIGKAIASRAAAFGCQVIATVGRDTPPPTPPELTWLGGRSCLDNLLDTADFVILSCAHAT